MAPRNKYTSADMGHIRTGFSVSLGKSIKEIPGFVENKYDRDKIFRELVENSMMR